MSTLGIRGLCGFFLQSFYEYDKPANIAKYWKPTLAECQAIHNHTYKAYLAFFMILILEWSIYSKLTKDLSNLYSMGTYQYPQTRAKIHNIIVHWRNHATHYSLRTPPGVVFFAQDNGNGLTSS